MDELTKHKTQKIIQQAKRKGYSIGEKISVKHHNLSSTLKKTAKSKIRKTVNAGKKLQVSKKENLEIFGHILESGLLEMENILHQNNMKK